MLYAVTQKTAAELITARADSNDPNFGLLHWKGDKVDEAELKALESKIKSRPKN